MPGRRSAFTLIEMVVVILLIAVVSGVIVPRLISTSDRGARAEAEAVAALMGAASRRASLTTQKVAVELGEGAVRVFTLRPRDAGDFSHENTRWMADPLLPPVPLEHLTITSAVRDGVSLNAGGWRVELGGENRPELVLRLEALSGRAWTVALSPEVAGAALLEGAEEFQSSAVDLDRTGKGLEAW